ncbi:hypothetical protein Vretimale_14838, partial [Volvox reticuliferus]
GDPTRVAADSLYHFASQGLRTLVLAARPLPDRAWYDNWDRRYQAAAAEVHTDPRVRVAALEALADEIECELQLVGVAAIEDQLQEGVPEAVATLLAAGVRVWMITGDKLETAVNIARSAHLVTQPHDSQLLVLREHEERDIRRQLRRLARRAAAINAFARGRKKALYSSHRVGVAAVANHPDKEDCSALHQNQPAPYNISPPPPTKLYKSARPPPPPRLIRQEEGQQQQHHQQEQEHGRQQLPVRKPQLHEQQLQPPQLTQHLMRMQQLQHVRQQEDARQRHDIDLKLPAPAGPIGARTDTCDDASVEVGLPAQSSGGDPWVHNGNDDDGGGHGSSTGGAGAPSAVTPCDTAQYSAATDLAKKASSEEVGEAAFINRNPDLDPNPYGEVFGSGEEE